LPTSALRGRAGLGDQLAVEGIARGDGLSSTIWLFFADRRHGDQLLDGKDSTRARLPPPRLHRRRKGLGAPDLDVAAHEGTRRAATTVRSRSRRAADGDEGADAERDAGDGRRSAAPARVSRQASRSVKSAALTVPSSAGRRFFPGPPLPWQERVGVGSTSNARCTLLPSPLAPRSVHASRACARRRAHSAGSVGHSERADRCETNHPDPRPCQGEGVLKNPSPTEERAR